MSVLQFGVMSESKNVFAFGIFLQIKDTSSVMLTSLKCHQHQKVVTKEFLSSATSIKLTVLLTNVDKKIFW